MAEVLSIIALEAENGGGGGGSPTNLTLSNFKAGIVVPQIRNNAEASNNNIATELAIRNAIDQAVAGLFDIQGNKDTEAEILDLTGSENYEAWICLENSKLYYWLDGQWLSVTLVDINTFIAKSNGIITTDLIPPASASNLGYTYFYTGATTTTFTTKSFYQCVETLPATTPKTYHYEEYKVAGEVFVDTDDLLTITNPSKQVIYRVASGTGNYKINDTVYNISEEHNIRAYKILDATQVQVSTTGITISGVSYSYGAMTTALQNALVNASMAGYISYVSAYDERNTFDNWFSNGEIDFIVTEIDYENTDAYYKDSLTFDAQSYKLYHNPTETAGVENFIEIGEDKQDKLTPTSGSVIQDTDTVSDVNLTTKKVIARTFTQVWNWIVGKLATAITNVSTNFQIPSAKAVYNLFDSKHIYMHSMGIKYSNVANYYGTLNIFNESNSPMDASGLATYLHSNGYDSAENQYPMSGSDDFVSRYCATTSGGSATKEFTTTGMTTGIYSTDGTSLNYVYNRVSTRTLSMGTGSGTWIKEINCIKIL